MPSLSICGRQWALASDDLPALAFLGALFHGAWLLLLIVFSIIALSLQKPKDCEELAVFMSLLLFSTLVSTISDVLIMWNGLKGSILQPSRRRFTEKVLYASVVNFLLKIVIIGYGTYLVFVSKPRCLRDTSELDQLMRAVIISTLVIAVLYLILFVVSYRAFPKNSVLQWKRRIRSVRLFCGDAMRLVFVPSCVNWCCCGDIDRHESESLARMALVLERFFRPMDFSATDTLASIFLAAKRQSFLRHDTVSDADELPRHLPSFEETAISQLNGIRVGDRALQEPLSQQIELHPRRLTTVSEDVEMDMMEHGVYPIPDGDMTSDEGLSPAYVRSPLSFELDQANDAYDNEVANIKPTHRRSEAMDFSTLDLEGLRFEATNHLAYDEGPSRPRTDSLSSPVDTSSAVTIESDVVVSSFPVNSEEADSLNEVEGSEGQESAETMLSWCDDCTGPFLTPSSGGLSELAKRSQTVDYDTLERMHLYHRYALASYGALLYMASSKRMVVGLGRLFGLCLHAAPPNSLNPFTSSEQQARSPNGSQRGSSLRQRLNEEAVLRYGFLKENILYRSHEDVFAGHLPYFVALDPVDKAVVVAVRGTWSWSDLVTDFLIHPEPLSAEESTEVNRLLAEVRGFDLKRAACLPEVSVHSGMLRSARGLIANLQRVGMLEFLETGSYDAAAEAGGLTLHDIHDWKFVMTGHSLGAGVVSLATLLLKSKYPNRTIECFAISPPGCTMSPELATAISPFCYSLIHAKDIVPRTNVMTVERLRDQMVRATTLCRRSKIRVLLSGLYKAKWKEDELFFSPEQVDAEPVEAFRRYRAKVQTANEEDLRIAREFIPPGKLVFLRPTKSPTTKDDSSSAFRRDFEAVWISGKDLMQEGILLSLFMIKDHFPYFSIETLKEIMDRRGHF